MIDVVFLLLVFFMLAARFGAEGRLAVGVAGPGAETAVWHGPPRLVEVTPDVLALNGVTMTPEALVTALAGLTSGPDDAVVVRARDGARLQRLVTVLELLEAAGHLRLVVVE